MKIYEIWAEGYKATGQESHAQLLSKYKADSFDAAVEQYHVEHDDCIDFNRYGKSRHAIWGCELFDNAIDARKSFG